MDCGDREMGVVQANGPRGLDAFEISLDYYFRFLAAHL